MTLTRKERITVIVTTHYIEEARQANVVGLMRQGRLLAENSPDQLMADHNFDTLEDVFLKLCMSDMSLKAASLSNYTSILPHSDLNQAANGTLSNKAPPSTEPSITSEQYKQIATNGDLKNYQSKMILFYKLKLYSFCFNLFTVSFSIFPIHHKQGSKLRPCACAHSLH